MFLGVHVSASVSALAAGMTTSGAANVVARASDSEAPQPVLGTSAVPWSMISAEKLAEILTTEKDKMQLLVIDSRSFLEYNTCHVRSSINVCCSKLVKRRLQHDKVTVKDLLAQTCHLDAEEYYDIIVYDQCSSGATQLTPDCFLHVLLSKLVKVFHKVMLLEGGFLNFQASHTHLCETKSTCSTSMGRYKCPPLTSMSQPCMPVSNAGPTRILPFLYLGSQQDALSQDTLKQYGVGYVLNISTTCPKPGHVKDNHFHRIPVNDNYSDKLAPYFADAFQFIDKVREANGCVLVHCLAGISRSPTVAIAYVMKHLNSTSEEAYKYVKDKRPTISPNFNFLGQLMEFEKQLRSKTAQPQTAVILTESSSLGGAIRKDTPLFTSSIGPGMKRSFSLHLTPMRETPVVQSPTTALARLNFNSPSPIDEMPAETPPAVSTHLNFPQFPSTSLDKLSFTPCFTKEEQQKNGAVSRVRHSSGNNNNSKVVAGTKRPLSTSGDFSPECDPCSAARQNSSLEKPVPMVVCRSPENKAKRPLVRPNSIAFSSYPKFDFGGDSHAGPISMTDCVRSPAHEHGPPMSTTGPHDQAKKTTDISSQSTSTNTERCPIQIRHKNQGNSNNLARKSQSLEDILNSQEEEEGSKMEWNSPSASRKKKGKHSHRTVPAADFFSPPVALDRGRCRGPSDPHQSSSSISSSGSHNSLQGSLELIPVS